MEAILTLGKTPGELGPACIGEACMRIMQVLAWASVGCTPRFGGSWRRARFPSCFCSPRTRNPVSPSRAVGSAAYNLLMITAVCVTALPGGQKKKISELRVFVTTAVWSICEAGDP